MSYSFKHLPFTSLTHTNYTVRVYVCSPQRCTQSENNSIIIFAIGTILLAHIICWIHLSKNTLHLTQWLHLTGQGSILIVVLSFLSPLPSSSLILFYYAMYIHSLAHTHSLHLLMDITFEEIAWFAIALISIEPPQ